MIVDLILTIAILIFFLLLIYTRVKKQSLTDTADEIKGIFSPPPIEEIITRPI